MKVIKINIDNTEYMFVCESRDTRYGFAHDTTLFINNINYGKYTCYYYNRTWEAWNFQSCCCKAIYTVINEQMQTIKEAFKEYHEYKRMTAKRTADLEKIYERNNTLARYKACLHELNTKLY